MDITDSEANEVRYQHRGYAKYVEIVNLFGWKVLEDFWHSVNQDYLEGIEYLRNTGPTDNRVLCLSQKAGVDLTPLVYDRLVYYKTHIPIDNSEFAEHARVVNPKGIRKGKARYSARGGIMPRCRTTTTPTARSPGPLCRQSSTPISWTAVRNEAAQPVRRCKWAGDGCLGFATVTCQTNWQIYSSKSRSSGAHRPHYLS